MLNRCEYCNASFDSINTKRFCCKRCNDLSYMERRKEIHNNIHLTLVCDYCKVEFTPKRFKVGNRQRFCSKTCNVAFHKDIVVSTNKQRFEEAQTECICDHCHKPFIPKRMWDVNNSRFCCRKCKVTYHKDKELEKKALVRQATIRTCPICGKQFTPKRTLTQIYCSLRCRTLIRKKIYKALQSCYEAIGTTKQDHSYNILGYTPKQLQAHLQNHPNWNKVKNRKWHLDHIFPIIAFLHRGITDIKLICCLDNLQPLLGKDNMRKNNKYDKTQFEAFLGSHSSLC